VLVGLFNVIKGLFYIEALRKRLFYTTFVLAVYRLGKHIPLPGIDLPALGVLKASFTGGGILGYLNTVTGGAITSCSLFSLGISPYIQASIIMQVAQFAFPTLEMIAKEGEIGRATISRYTRYLAAVLSIIQGIGLVGWLERGLGTGIQLVVDPDWVFRLKALVMLSVGALFVMWLGEQISRFGIGQGSSILVFAGIVSSAPVTILHVIEGVMHQEIPIISLLATSLFILFLTGCIIFLEKGERRVPVCYAKRIIGRASASFSGVTSYLPFKINPAGVMPVILTQPVLAMMANGLDYLTKSFAPDTFLNGLFLNEAAGYNVLMVLFIILFNFNYLTMIVNVTDIADNLRKSSGFIPGIRPGVKTMEYIDHLLVRIGTPGAIYMAVLAVIPSLARYYFSLPFFVTGLSLLIAVGVALDTSSQVEAYFVENRYEGFILNSGIGRASYNR